jgi:hypothetical protein
MEVADRAEPDAALEPATAKPRGVARMFVVGLVIAQLVWFAVIGYGVHLLVG